jgi:hypothetical protein
MGRKHAAAAAHIQAIAASYTPQEINCGGERKEKECLLKMCVHPKLCCCKLSVAVGM